MQGRHLVIVTYGPRDIPGEEWIANKPDPRSAKIIWARDMGAVKNEELLRAYPGRHVWFVNRSDPLRRLVAAQPQRHSSTKDIIRDCRNKTIRGLNGNEGLYRRILIASA